MLNPTKEEVSIDSMMPRLVEMVYPAGDRAYVRGPVEAGDRIIVDGLQRVTPGARVTPRDVQRADTASGG